jgi:hypothetical protein
MVCFVFLLLAVCLAVAQAWILAPSRMSMSGTVALTREAGNNSKLAKLLKDRGIHSVEVCTMLSCI